MTGGKAILCQRKEGKQQLQSYTLFWPQNPLYVSPGLNTRNFEDQKKENASSKNTKKENILQISFILFPAG